MLMAHHISCLCSIIISDLKADVPYDIVKLYNYSSVTFDQHYNSHFAPVNFSVPQGTTRVNTSSIFYSLTVHGPTEAM